MTNDVIEILISYGVNQVEIFPHYPTPQGNISAVCLRYITYSHGEAGSYEDLHYKDLQNLAEAVEQEILCEDEMYYEEEYYS